MNQDFKKMFWVVVDKFCFSMDVVEYKYIVFGFIFFKYIFDVFDQCQQEFYVVFEDEVYDFYFFDVEDCVVVVEECDYYIMVNVFWVLGLVCWEIICVNVKQVDIGICIDLVLDVIEVDNFCFKGILDKCFGCVQLEFGKLGELIDFIFIIGFGGGLKVQDLLGEVYEYFFGQFVNVEGKKGGQFYMFVSVVKVFVEVLVLYKGKVYDFCCGLGGMFVQSEKFIESYGGKFGDILIYGQEVNLIIWCLVVMNLVICGMDFNFGKELVDIFYCDQYVDLCVDYVLVNLFFNISDWGGDWLLDDCCWVYGMLFVGNVNYVWLQYILYYLVLCGQVGVVLVNGSMLFNQNSEGDICCVMVEVDVVEVMVVLLLQFFFNMQILVCLWFLVKDKSKVGCDWCGEVFFIDVCKLGWLEMWVNCVFDDEDVVCIVGIVYCWW